MKKFLWLTLPPLVNCKAHTRVVAQAMEDTEIAKEPGKKDKEVGKHVTDSSAAETAMQDNSDKKEFGQHVTDSSVDGGAGLLDVQSGLFDYTITKKDPCPPKGDYKSDTFDENKHCFEVKFSYFGIALYEGCMLTIFNVDANTPDHLVKMFVNSCSKRQMHGLLKYEILEVPNSAFNEPNFISWEAFKDAVTKRCSVPYTVKQKEHVIEVSFKYHWISYKFSILNTSPYKLNSKEDQITIDRVQTELSKCSTGEMYKIYNEWVNTPEVFGEDESKYTKSIRYWDDLVSAVNDYDFPCQNGR